MAFEKVKKLNSDLKEKYPRLHKSARLNPLGTALALPTIATAMGAKKVLESDKAQSIKEKLKSKFRGLVKTGKPGVKIMGIPEKNPTLYMPPPGYRQRQIDRAKGASRGVDQPMNRRSDPLRSFRPLKGDIIEVRPGTKKSRPETI